MAAINDLIARIQDPDLRMRIEKEVKDFAKQKKFGLVFEKHEPEMTLLYDYPISRGCKVIRKSDDDKKLSEDILWVVKKVSCGTATCEHAVTKKEQHVCISDLICVAKNGEPIYPCLKFVDSIQNAPDSDLWHTLIEADNYHALQLLAYLYPHMVDCIYIDPPYNSGATDWKYNNNYVDGNDSYRHSKWLAMMESRLLLAKKLLNPDNSVLIVTIDEKEYLNLGCLLEETFSEAKIQMVSSCINYTATARRNQFDRVNEYIFIVMIGDCQIFPQDDSKNFKQNDEVNWRGLRRQNASNIRDIQHPNQFFPIYISTETNTIVKVGENLPFGESIDNVEKIEGCETVFPIKDNGVEMMWGLSRDTFLDRLSKGYVKVGRHTPNKPQKYILSFLERGMIEGINNGDVIITGKRADGSVIAVYNTQRKVMPKTQWTIKSHDAREYGTYLLDSTIGEKRFSYPKSLYAVHDVLRLFVAELPNALILDFFAGSGTTLHAVNLLNKEDGGHRRCIMVTNNEVSAEEETEFRANGLHKGDEDWEKFGIARYVNWPRTKCSIEGVDVNGQPINGEYITSNTQEVTFRRAIKQLSLDIPKGTQGIKVKKQIVALINDKKMPQNSVTANCPYIAKGEATNAILFDINCIDDFFEEIHEDIETIYVVTTNNNAFNAVKRILEDLPERTKTIPVTIPMSEGFRTNAAFYKLTFLDKETVSLGTQLDKMLPILWMKAGAHGVCPSHIEGEYIVLPENKMAILIDEYAFNELKEELAEHPEIETIYIIDDSEDNYRALAAQINVKNTYQLYRDYLDNFKINIEKR